MANQYINKVVYGGTTLIDLTSDTVTAAALQSGVTAHDRSGAVITGTNTFDANTSDADALASEILINKTAYVAASKITGSMPNRGAVSGSIAAVSDEYTVPLGYHDGSGKVSIDPTEQIKIIGQNIRQGVTILGVVGTMSGSENVHAQARTATPSVAQFVVTPETGYNYLTQVTVEAIPYVETDNVQGGVTVTIA